MRNITGLSRLPASDYAESGCKGTTFFWIMCNNSDFFCIFAP